MRSHPSPGGPIPLVPHQHLGPESAPLHAVSPACHTEDQGRGRASPRRPSRAGQAACALGPRTECSEPREHQLAAHFSKAAQRPHPPATERASGRKVGYQEGQGPGEEPGRQAAQWIHASTKVNTRAEARTAGCCKAVHAKMKTVTNALECELSLSKMSLQLK